MHKVFWDILESELNDDPPNYQQAIRLLGEIREVCTNTCSDNDRQRFCLLSTST